MRALIWLVLLAGGLWCGWWWVAATGLERGTAAWFDAQTAAGRTATRSSDTVRGFPNRLDLTISDPVLDDPASGFGWRAPFVQVFALSYKPWHLITALPPEQTVTLPDGSGVTITAEKLMASLIVTPGADLALDRSTLAGDGLRLTRGDTSVGVDTLRFGTRQAGTAAVHGIALELTGISPGGLPATSGLAPRIETVRVDTELTFDAALDRHAGITQPALVGLVLREGRINWGDLVIHGKGSLAADATGRAEGRIDIRISDWSQALRAAVAAGLITPEVAPTWARGLEMLERAGNGPKGQLDLPLVMGKGRMTLGPLPLGPAPQLTLN